MALLEWLAPSYEIYPAGALHPASRIDPVFCSEAVRSVVPCRPRFHWRTSFQLIVEGSNRMNRFVKGSALVAAVGLFAAAQQSQAATPAYRAAVLGDGATAYYEFDTVTPTDSAGGDNNGSFVGTVT